MGDEKLKEKEMSTEIQTDFEKPEYSKLGEFCQKHGINSNLIMLKITLFVMYGGKINIIRKIEKYAHIPQNLDQFDHKIHLALPFSHIFILKFKRIIQSDVVIREFVL